MKNKQGGLGGFVAFLDTYLITILIDSGDSLVILVRLR